MHFVTVHPIEAERWDENLLNDTAYQPLSTIYHMIAKRNSTSRVHEWERNI